MQNIDPSELSNVVGGTSTSSDQITQQLTSLTSTIQGLNSNSNNSGGSNNSMMMMAMAMAMRPHDTVVAGGGGPPMVAAAPAVAAGPVVNVRTRVR